MTIQAPGSIVRSARRMCRAGNARAVFFAIATTAGLAGTSAADSISNLQLVAETPSSLIVSVDYEYDSPNGDCMQMRARADSPSVGYTTWPVHPGTDHAFLTLRNTSAVSSPATTQITIEMRDCDGTVVHFETFPFPKSWSPATTDFINRDVVVLSEDPAKLELEVKLQLGSGHAAPVRLWARAIGPGGVGPFAQGLTPSAPLAAGPGTAVTAISLITAGTFRNDAILIELREDGGPPFHTAVIPRVKYWSDDLVDTDADGLSDTTESTLGTHPGLEDTDDDGLLDGWELQGYRFTDGRIHAEGNLPLLGANPLHRDVFVEIDYVVTAIGDQKMHVDSINKAKTTYAETPIANPDGKPGIAIHVYHDDPIANTSALGGVCGMRNYLGLFDESAHRIYHWAIAGPGEGGQADTVSNHLTFGTGNGNPGMDTRSKFMAYATFVHELGHNLGLDHVGTNGSGQTNCKPNYPSLMNYAYDYTFECSRMTLADTKIRFSDGSAPTVSLNALDETTLPTGLDFLVSFDSDWSELGCNAFDVDVASGTVDWNRNGTIDPGLQSVSTSDVAPSCGDQGTPADQRDSDDFGTMQQSMAEAIRNPRRSDCSTAGPGNGWMVFGAKLQMEPVCGVGRFQSLLEHPWLRDNPVFHPEPGTVLSDPQMLYELAPLIGPNGELGDPETLDLDQDQVPDFLDDCLGVWNPAQDDPNGDGIGTACQCGDTNFDGVHDQADLDALAACASAPQTCQLDPGLADTNDDGMIDQADFGVLAAHLQDPLVHPVQDLTCSLRSSGITPHRYVPEPALAPALIAALLALAAPSRAAAARRSQRSSRHGGSGSRANHRSTAPG